MLKATINGKYRKAGTGNLVYTYAVTGTAKELAEYLAAQAEQQATTVEQLKKTATGQPLFWFSPSPTQGRIARKTFNLSISFNGKIVIDDMNESIERDIKIDDMSMAHEAQILAEIRLGVRQVIASTATAAPVKKEQVLDTPDDLKTDDLDQAAHELQGAKEQLQPAGNEELND